MTATKSEVSLNRDTVSPLPGARRYYLDWLRVLLILMVFLFHVARFFDEIWWHIKDNHQSRTATTLVMLLSLWGMPFLFLVSGAATRLAFSHLPQARAYLTERFKRLIIPFLFGIFIIVPPQVYFERLQKKEFTGSYLQFYPHYFDGLYFFGGNFSWIGHHLWFLLVLFVISVLTLPVLLWMQGEQGQKFVLATAALTERCGSALCLALPIIIFQVSLRAIGIVDPFVFVLFFIYGFMIFSDHRFERLIERDGPIALIIAIVSTIVYSLAFQFDYYTFAELSRFSLKHVCFQILAGINSWAWTIALLGLGMRYLNRNNRVLKYANEAVMPFYVLHQTVIIFIGYYIIQSQDKIAMKYIFIAVPSLVVTILLYELIVKRNRVISLLFGVKLK